MVNFSYKTITDSIHGPIGISELEHRIINTRTFQRLKRIKQLGLVHYVFPGAEHSRFSHSVGAMHVMSQMVERLEHEGCHQLKDNTEKQRLRLAALLHDIGHYPLSHAGEDVFKWLGETQSESLLDTQSISEDTHSLLDTASRKHSYEKANHERLGEVILTKAEDVGTILKEAGFSGKDLAKIINGDTTDNPFHVQLMSSTLDCDRLDYLRRDSIATGVTYGLVDTDYIIRAMTWDSTEERVCFFPKSINSLEHFVLARYFHYNIIFHRVVLGFEIIAKALFYAMMNDKEFAQQENLVHSIEDIELRIQSDEEFLFRFSDEYFWNHLQNYKPRNGFMSQLKDQLLRRVPLRTVFDERRLLERGKNGAFHRWSVNELWDRESIREELEAASISKDCVCCCHRSIDLEERSHKATIAELKKVTETTKEDEEGDPMIKLIKVKINNNLEELLALPGTILQNLSENRLHLVRVFACLDKEADKQKVTVLTKLIEQQLSPLLNY